MIPTITDGLLLKAIQSRRMMDAGQDYWRQGRVSEIMADADGARISARVGGSGPDPYRVRLHFERGTLSNGCSCPVQVGCKHVAALLFALRANARLSTGPQFAPQLAAWINRMKALDGADQESKAVFYLVNAQLPDGTQRTSKKRPPEALAIPGFPLRLIVEPIKVAVDHDGAPIGSGEKLKPQQLGYGRERLMEGLEAEDRMLLLRALGATGEADHIGCLKGGGSLELLMRLVETGRARWGTLRGTRLVAAPAVSCQLHWAHDRAGNARLAIADVPAGAMVGLGGPPVLLDLAAGTIAPIELGLAPSTAEHLLAMPAVAPDQIAALVARWPSLVPAEVPPPRPPRIRDLGTIAPVPVLTLMMEQLRIYERRYYRYHMTGSANTASALARLSFDYEHARIGAGSEDAQTLLVRDGDGFIRFSRDIAAEADAHLRLFDTELQPLAELDHVDSAERQDWDFVPHAPAQAQHFVPFLLDEAEALRAEGWRVELAPNFPLRISHAEIAEPAISIAETGVDWFDLEMGARVDGELVDLVPALRQILSSLTADKRATLLSGETRFEDRFPVVFADGRVATVDAEQITPLLRALLMVAGRDAAGREGFSRHDLGLLAEMEAGTPGFAWRGAEPLRRLARSLAELRLESVRLPDGFGATLRPYQQTGLDWLDALSRAGLGGVLADDMGLGKTVQTLAHLATLKARGDLELPALIVAPTSVLPNWQAEIERFTPELSTLLLHGPERHERREDVGAHDLVLTSYPLLVRDRQMLAKQHFALVVLDEAHNLKNPRTAGHAAARELQAGRKVALTGTPVENRLTDAWALFELVMPGLLGPLKSFNHHFRSPIEKHGDAQARAGLARKVRPFLLRRTKDQVAGDLPAKSIVPLVIPLPPEQMALHESQRLIMQERVRNEIARVGLMRAQIMVLTALTRLRQVSCDPRLVDAASKAPSAKLERLLELLDEMVAEGRRIILFSQFTSMLDLIKPELDARGFAWTELTGQAKDRKTPVERFQKGEVPLILVSLKAGGTGLNLTAADTVLLYDPWWNPAVEAQAIDRAHRIGQTKPVFVYRMIGEGTIEEKILALQQRKAALAEALWSEDPAGLPQLGEDDIEFLLG